MRKYEMMTVYPIQNEKFDAATNAVKKIFSEFGVTIEKEDSYSERDLAYEVKNERRGKFILYTINVNPAKLTEIDRSLKLVEPLLKYMFVRIDE